jgi:arylsulfatase A-like enzyme
MDGVLGMSEPRPPNIVVGVLDCARAKSFAVSGGVRTARTPEIDRMAAEGTAFPRAVAPANWTVPSHMSIMTGAYPNVHGRRTFVRGNAPMETMASWLLRQGYDTAQFSEMIHLSSGYGLEDGYETVRSRRTGVSDDDRTLSNRLMPHLGFLYGAGVRTLVERVPPFIVPMNAVNHPQEVAYKEDVCGEYVLEYIDDWLKGRSREKPFHLFFNLVNAHEPYELVANGTPPNFLGRWYARTPRYYLLSVRGLQSHVPWEAVEGGYLRSIEEADAKIGRLRRLLESHGEAERTIFILTADHGQSFGEGGNVYHGCGATDSIARVPLVVVGTPEHSLPRRVDRWTSLTEISSWVRAAASGKSPYDDSGHAPFPFLAGAPDDSTVFCEGGPASDPNRSLRGINPDQSWNHRLLAAYRADAKYVLDLDTDQVVRWLPGDDPDHRPPERPDREEMSRWRETVFGNYEQRDRDRRSRSEGTPTLDVTLDERLRSWGYD